MNSVTTFGYQKPQSDGRDAAQACAKLVNRSSRVDEFLEEFDCTHRTLKQGIMRLFIRLVEHVAKTEPGCYDARNEASVRFAKAIVETKEWKTLTGLPLI